MDDAREPSSSEENFHLKTGTSAGQRAFLSSAYIELSRRKFVGFGYFQKWVVIIQSICTTDNCDLCNIHDFSGQCDFQS